MWVKDYMTTVFVTRRSDALLLSKKMFKKMITLPRTFYNVGKILSSHPKVLSAFASQFIWYNEYTKSDNNTIYNRYFSQK